MYTHIYVGKYFNGNTFRHFHTVFRAYANLEKSLYYYYYAVGTIIHLGLSSFVGCSVVFVSAYYDMCYLQKQDDDDN